VRLAWSHLSPFEKTVAVAAVFELALFLAVSAVPAVVVGRTYMLYWVVLGPPSLLFAPLLHRLFKYLDEERPIVQHRKSKDASIQEQTRGEA
jgi:hypothetical protein